MKAFGPRFLVLASILFSGYAAEAAEAQRPKRLLLLGQGPDGHPPATHEYLLGLKVLKACLDRTPEIAATIERADEPWEAGPAKLAEADGVVIFLSEGAKWAQADPRRLDALARLAQRGGGFVALHWGMGTKDAAPIDSYLKLLGGCHGGPDRRYAVVEATLRPAEPRHPIATALEPALVREEFYFRLKFAAAPAKVEPVLTVPIEGRDETVAWACQRPDGGRSAGFSGLHFHENWREPAYRRLVVQSVLWSLKLPIPAAGANVDVAEEILAGPQR